jgi:hypothetical protein
MILWDQANLCIEKCANPFYSNKILVKYETVANRI